MFVAGILPDSMVPDRILAMERLPVSATGKIVRRRLAETVAGLLAETPSRSARTEPATAAEREVARLVGTLLQSADIDLEADFNALGGNSFLALELLIALERELGCQLSPADFLADRSVAGLARLVEARRAEASTRYVVQQRPGTGGPILFLAHSVYGSPTYFNAALPHLGPDIAVYALQWERPKGSPMETLARHAAGFVAAMRAVQPVGPYCLAGHSFAGHLAFEVAQHLFAAGEDVAFLAVLDDSADLSKRNFAALDRIPGDDTTEQATVMLARSVQLPYPGDLWLYRARDTADEILPDPALGWCDIVCGDVHAVDVPGTHMSMVSEDFVGDWIGGFRDDLRAAWAAARDPRSAREPAAVRLRRARDRASRPDVAAVLSARQAGKTGDLAGEIDAYRRAVRLNADQPYWVYRNLADALEQAGDRTGAAMAYLESAEREAIPIYGYGLAGTALGLLGHHAAATEAFRKAEQCDGDDILVQRAMVSLEIRRGRHDVAEARLRQMVATFADMWSYESLSAFLADRERFDEAIRFATELCETQPLNIRLRRTRDAMVARRADAAAAVPKSAPQPVAADA
jgi:thioesterase domain-containing protein/acyl carrier protein